MKGGLFEASVGQDVYVEYLRHADDGLVGSAVADKAGKGKIVKVFAVEKNSLYCGSSG